MGRTKWHFWVIGIVALIWNAGGAYDYVMSQTRNEAYMSAFSPEQLEFFYGLPAWTVAAWAIGVWGGVVGTVLLLLKKRAAIWVYAASLAGIAITTIQNYFLANGFEVSGDAFSLTFSAAIIVVGIALLLYARAMLQRGVLR
jgi:hypothetical protein